MEWTILDADRSPQDPSGVEGFIQRMDQELRGGGPPLEGFRFLNSGSEMLRITREIEHEVLGNSGTASVLYVGFQTGEKLHNETKRYSHLNQAGVTAVGFGQGEPAPESVQMLEQWVNLPADTRAFENQWYLVIKAPVPIVFIGWETSAPEMFGQGGIAKPGKQFRGFVSNDQRVVDGVVAHLERVRRQYGPTVPMPLNQLAQEIPFPVQRIMVITDDGQNNEIAALREDAIKFAVDKSAFLMLYDVSAASYLVSPYPNAEYETEWNRPLFQKELGMIGRQSAVDQLNKLDEKGVCAGIILPKKHGFDHLAEWAEQEQADLVMIPSHLVRPGLIDRIKGYTLKNLLDNTSIPVVVYEPGGQVWMRSQASRQAARGNGEALAKLGAGR